MSYFIQPNGVLMVNRTPFNYQVQGFKENPDKKDHGDPLWIDAEDITEKIDPDFMDNYNPWEYITRLRK